MKRNYEDWLAEVRLLVKQQTGMDILDSEDAETKVAMRAVFSRGDTAKEIADEIAAIHSINSV